MADLIRLLLYAVTREATGMVAPFAVRFVAAPQQLLLAVNSREQRLIMIGQDMHLKIRDRGSLR
jgi:hypothetical protein